MLLKTETTDYIVERVWPKKMIVDHMHILRSKQYYKEEFGANSTVPNPRIHCVKCEKEFQVGDKVQLVFFTNKKLPNRLACSACSEEITKALEDNKDN